jgi:hypothetical protein
MEGLGYATGAVWLALVIFGIVLAILWLLVPFAVFGIKKRQDAQLRELRVVTANLQAIFQAVTRPR